MLSPLLSRYKDFLPITPKTPIITLGEGGTPLIPSVELGNKLGAEVFFKLEGCNPTGSFKDRGMVLAVAKAIEEGSRGLICASTGNTSASAAAYGARFKLKVFIVIPAGKVAKGKFAQLVSYGADVIPIEGGFDQALSIVRYLAGRKLLTLVNSLNHYRLEGQKTAAFEIVDELGDAPDYLFIPVGNAGNITAYWGGFVQYYDVGRAKRKPKMMGFEAEGAAAIVRNRVIPNPETIATAIRIGNPAHWAGAVKARDESGGLIDCVSDREIIDSYRWLAEREGIFGEPASAAGVAGLFKLAGRGMDFRGKRIVCVITGSGLKDTSFTLSLHPPLSPLPPDQKLIEKILEERL